MERVQKGSDEWMEQRTTGEERGRWKWHYVIS